jgi:hypothetical protein
MKSSNNTYNFESNCKCPDDPSCLNRRFPAKSNTCADQKVYPTPPVANPPTSARCSELLKEVCSPQPSNGCAPRCNPDKCWNCVNSVKSELLQRGGCTIKDLASYCKYLSPTDADNLGAISCEKYFSNPLVGDAHVCKTGRDVSGRNDMGGWNPQGKRRDGQDAWYVYKCTNGDRCNP